MFIEEVYSVLAFHVESQLEQIQNFTIPTYHLHYCHYDLCQMTGQGVRHCVRQSLDKRCEVRGYRQQG